jgi:catechol 2,3-dioxygenase
MKSVNTIEAEPLFEVAHLASVELYSPRRKDSVAFFTELLGMYVVRVDKASTYLRGYEDPYAYSLKITDGKEAGPGIATFRTHSRQALERRAKVLAAEGLGDGWIDSDFGHGRAYLFHTPDGHPMKLIWDVEYADVSNEHKTGLRNRPSKRPAQGIPVRRLDHINYLCSDVTVNKNALIEHLGFNLSEHIVMDDKSELAAWLRTTALAHDVALMKDPTPARGRLHHVAFWYGIPQHLMDLAELCVQRGIKVEAGPGKHGISQALFLYVIEPGGNRVELFGDSGYLIFDPTWKPVTWTQQEIQTGIIWIGAELPQEFFLYATPPAPPAGAASKDAETAVQEKETV